MKKHGMKAFRLIIILTTVFLLSIPLYTGCGNDTDPSVSISYSASALPEGTVGTAYSADVAKAAGAEGISYALKSGDKLPGGLTLSSAGKITGTPTAAVNAAKFTVVASADGAESAEAQFSITIKEAPPAAAVIKYDGKTLDDATTGEAYEADIATATGAEGIGYALKSGSSLPAGLTLSPAGKITGTPTEAVNAAKFTVVASADGAESAEAQFTLTVKVPEKAEISYTGTTLSDARVDTAYEADVATATGAKGISYALKSGSSLPAGLTLSPEGKITGTPTTAANAAKFTIVASADGAESAEAEFTLNVLGAEFTEKYVIEAEWGLSGDDIPNAVYGTEADASGGMYVDFRVDEVEAPDTSTVKYSFTPSRSGEASLALTLGLREFDATLDEIFEMRINGEPVSFTAYVPENDRDVTGKNDWVAWTEITAGIVELEGGKLNTIELTMPEEDSAFNLDCLSLSVPAAQSITMFGCTEVYEGDPAVVSLGLDDPDMSQIEAAFGSGYAVTEIREMYGAAGSQLGTDHTDVTNTVNDMAFGSYMWKVTAAKGEETASMMIPVEVKAANMAVFEAEWALNNGDSRVSYQTGQNSSGYGFAGLEEQGSSVVLKFDAAEAGRVKLSLRIGLRDIEGNTLADAYSISLNGTPLSLEDIVLEKGGGWFDWQQITVGETNVIEGPNTLVITRPGEDSYMLDSLQFILPATQQLTLAGVTDEYDGETVTVNATVNNAEYPVVIDSVDTAALAAAFGDGYEITGIYDMNEFYGKDMGKALTGISATLTSQSLGSHVWKVTAAKGEETATMIVPVEMVSNFATFEAEDGNISAGTEGDLPGKANGNGATGVDFHQKDGYVEFTFNVGEATDDAVLFVNLGRRDQAQALSDTYTIFVNGVELDTTGVQVPVFGGSNNWNDWYDVKAGTIALKAGEVNTIKIVGGDSSLILNNISVWTPAGIIAEPAV